MSEPKKPLIGYMILEEWCDDMSHWDGVISFPDPTGSNLAWENPIAMIEKSAYDKLKAENARLRGALEKISDKKGFCIFGSMDISDDPEHAFRQGSAQAFYDCAEMADEALKSCEVKGE